MGDIVNLRRVKRRLARAAEAEAAGANRARHGRTKTDTQAAAQREELARHRLDQARLGSGSDPGDKEGEN